LLLTVVQGAAELKKDVGLFRSRRPHKTNRLCFIQNMLRIQTPKKESRKSFGIFEGGKPQKMERGDMIKKKMQSGW
jgi:hypothetical protein